MMRTPRLPLSLLLLCMLLAGVPGCAREETLRVEEWTFRQVIMGCEARITLCGHDAEAARRAGREAFLTLDHLDSLLSNYRPRSELSLLCAHVPGISIPVSPQLYDVLLRSEEMSTASDGTFDVSAGAVYSLWRTARSSGTWPTSSSITKAMETAGQGMIILDPATRSVMLQDPGTRIDLGGIGKGFAADQALAVLAQHGFHTALVDLGGDIAIGDPPPGRGGWLIAVGGNSSPTPPLLLSNCGTATSGDTEQYMIHDGIRYSHLIDPRTGWPLENQDLVMVIAPDAATADALASALSVLGPDADPAQSVRWKAQVYRWQQGSLPEPPVSER